MDLNQVPKKIVQAVRDVVWARASLPAPQRGRRHPASDRCSLRAQVGKPGTPAEKTRKAPQQAVEGYLRHGGTTAKPTTSTTSKP
jgi:hypothetical protein